jgi:hypothetical protein
MTRKQSNINDKLSREYGLLVGVEGELYYIQQSRYVYIFVELLPSGVWEARKEYFVKDKQKAIRVATIWTNRSLGIVLDKVSMQLSYLNNGR